MAKLVTLDRETEDLIRDMKDNDPDFNFSEFVRNTIKNDTSRLSQEQIDLRIKTKRIAIEELLLEIKDLEAVLPMVQKKAEIIDMEHEDLMRRRLKNAIDVLIRTSNNMEWVSKHSELTGISEAKLITMADEEKEKRRIEAEKREIAHEKAMKELDI